LVQKESFFRILLTSIAETMRLLESLGIDGGSTKLVRLQGRSVRPGCTLIRMGKATSNVVSQNGGGEGKPRRGQ
jgi:hypothetical protein